MNKIKIIALMIIMLCLFSCQRAGTSYQYLNGNEQNLPPELKGLKVYWVYIDNSGAGVNVAVLNGEVNSLNYKSGKTHRSTIMVNNQNNRIIEIKEILLENDSLIVCRK
ncbi:hypothetical protein M0Q97_04250 [Candidatus Dojkabacteria bacterium]|jgi:hypothetical protein|nr:hypothetical protein [Candidatus Dojkabacteria bacterium]